MEERGELARNSIKLYRAAMSRTKTFRRTKVQGVFRTGETPGLAVSVVITSGNGVPVRRSTTFSVNVLNGRMTIVHFNPRLLASRECINVVVFRLTELPRLLSRSEQTFIASLSVIKAKLFPFRGHFKQAATS